MAGSSFGSPFTINTSELKKLAADLEKTTPGLKKSLNLGLREGAALTVTEAKALSSWSSTIPASIRIAGAQTKVVVRAGGAKARHAAAYEHRGMPGEFRHPVFGNKSVWVSQKARPFLGPALTSSADAVAESVNYEVGAVFEAAGFKGAATARPSSPGVSANPFSGKASKGVRSVSSLIKRLG